VRCVSRGRDTVVKARTAPPAASWASSSPRASLRPRAAAANCGPPLGFEQVGGFFEGVRAAEDTDLAALQQAGWRLELRPRGLGRAPLPDHAGDLRRQWRGYAAGRAWLAPALEGFVRGPAGPGPGSAPGRVWPGRRLLPAPPPAVRAPRTSGVSFLALDACCRLDELVGFALSNRPAPRVRTGGRSSGAGGDRFPGPRGPLVEGWRGPGSSPGGGAGPSTRARSSWRPAPAERSTTSRRRPGRSLCAATCAHPSPSVRCARDRLGPRPGRRSHWRAGPAVLRAGRDVGAPGAQALGGEPGPGRLTAAELAALAGGRSAAEARSVRHPSAYTPP